MQPSDTEATEPVALPGARDVRGTLDRADPTERSDAVVVACPPHPQYGGTRSDPRLRAVSERLVDRGVDCLRFDYGSWADGTGERRDLRVALAWAGKRYSRIGLFGYSFGGAVAILVAAEAGEHGAQKEDASADAPAELAALCALSPGRRLPDGAEVPASVKDVTAPAALVYGRRDETVELEPTVVAARRAGWTVTELDADHLFTGMQSAAADAVIDTFEKVFA